MGEKRALALLACLALAASFLSIFELPTIINMPMYLTRPANCEVYQLNDDSFVHAQRTMLSHSHNLDGFKDQDAGFTTLPRAFSILDICNR